VGLVAVGLDDQALVAPEEVDLLALHDGVDLRPRQPVRVTEVAHQALEIRARQRRLVVHGGDDAREGARAGPARVGGDDGVRLLEVEEPQRQRALDGTLERAGSEHRCEVELGSGDGRRRDALVLGDVGGGERA
jgi:hypothetical protein